LLSSFIPKSNILIINHLLVIAGCLLSQKETYIPVPGKVIDTVVCASDPSQSYALYIPRAGNGSPLPVVYFFDSHGVGALPLDKYKSLADAYGLILVGSNNSKNGNDWPTAEKIWGHLYEDTKHRLKIDDRRVYTCGFSGGAKVASYLAIQHPLIRGVIVNGAGLPDGVSAGDFAFSLTAITGQGDMNMTDLIDMNGELDKTRTRHRLILFDGKHEWAPVATMRVAFEGLQFDAMLQTLIPRDETAIDRYIAISKDRVGEAMRANQLIRAWRECRLSASLLAGLSGQASWFSQKAAAMENDPAYQKQQRQEADLLAQEQRTKSVYMQHFQDGGAYWVQTIRDLNAKAAVKSAAAGMYQRLLAWLSLAFYSLSNRLISEGQNPQARYFVELYKLADPTNSEAWYFSAILHARDADTQDTEADLLKAVGCGFRDKERMMQQQEFRGLGAKLDLAAVKDRMK
jgi:pimeloyl-ACP methyl ester carboxylesterase